MGKGQQRRSTSVRTRGRGDKKGARGGERELGKDAVSKAPPGVTSKGLRGKGWRARGGQGRRLQGVQSETQRKAPGRDRMEQGAGRGAHQPHEARMRRQRLCVCVVERKRYAGRGSENKAQAKGGEIEQGRQGARLGQSETHEGDEKRPAGFGKGKRT